ncbi:unnamed protein product [Nippostrongylus brasiliensis]|uniref:Uncharacterized protein n=1 Tax=Nippostrongylus brasiliensis TaxID=27835 RepID=A0A0N4XI60_NIPBR|nr:unnamed protein product [Nippostrongylus brasiliensis]
MRFDNGRSRDRRQGQQHAASQKAQRIPLGSRGKAARVLQRLTHLRSECRGRSPVLSCCNTAAISTMWKPRERHRCYKSINMIRFIKALRSLIPVHSGVCSGFAGHLFYLFVLKRESLRTTHIVKRKRQKK